MPGRIATGSLRQRGGHWVVRVPGGINADGSRELYQETLQTKRTAVARRDELLDKLRKNPGKNLRELLERELQPQPEVIAARALLRAEARGDLPDADLARLPAISITGLYRLACACNLSARKAPMASSD